MMAEIYGVEEAILDAETAMIEFNNAIRELEWEIFDKMMEAMSGITGESDFLIDLMSDEKMHDENGNLTDEGQATMGLHALNYNAYMAQADEYAKELAEIDKQLAEDPYNQDLLERRQELLEQQREMILAAEDEKQAILDLVREGYEAMLNSLQEVIDKQKEALQAEKDLYDYQKTIAEKTKNIATLEKQLMALEGDDSEETQSKIQQIKVDLEKAREDLEQTEYDKWLSDQQEMLDNLYADAQDWVNQRLDNVEQILQEAIDSTNANAEQIKQTLEDQAGAVGTTLSDAMKSIWSTTGEGAAANVVSMYGSAISGQMTTIAAALEAIKKYIADMVGASDEEAKEDVDDATNGEEGGDIGDAGQPEDPPPPPPEDPKPEEPAKDWGHWFVKEEFKGNKSKLDKETAIVDRLKYNDIASAMSYRKKYYEAMGLGSASSYKGTAKQNRAMIKLMKEHGYKKGSKYVPEDQLNWIHDGEIVYRPSDGGMLVPLEQNGKVYTKEMANNLWNLAKTPNIFSGLTTTATIPKGIIGNGNNNVQNDVVMNISLPGVQDVDGFVNELRNNKRFEKVVQSMTIGNINPKGNNSLSKFKY